MTVYQLETEDNSFFGGRGQGAANAKLFSLHDFLGMIIIMVQITNKIPI